MLYILVGHYQTLNAYNRTFDSLFIGFHRNAWSIANMWVIYACQYGYGGKRLNRINLYRNLGIEPLESLKTEHSSSDQNLLLSLKST